MEIAAPPLTGTLRRLRQARRLSQLELSLRLGVSQRHLSCVESGRSRPSRRLLLAWLQDLEAPLVVRNQALLQAGYAPAYGRAPLEDPALAPATQALEQLLAAHDPLPALVLDASWNVLRFNRGGRWLAATLLGDAAAAGGSMNILALLAHPEGLCGRIVNLQEVGPPLLSYLRQEAAVLPELGPSVEAFTALLRDRLGQAAQQDDGAAPTAPVLTTRYRTAQGELAFFSLFTTFGTPQDITLASLRVEHLFPADGFTRAVLEAQVPPGPEPPLPEPPGADRPPEPSR